MVKCMGMVYGKREERGEYNDGGVVIEYSIRYCSLSRIKSKDNQ